MKAVFVKRDCLIANDVEGASLGVSLEPGVSQGMERLSRSDVTIIVLDTASCAVDGAPSAADSALNQQMIEAIRQQRGRVDALLSCPHQKTDGCSCWGEHPGFLYAAAVQLDLRLDDCAVLGNEANDVDLAYRVGCRPILILGERSIGEVYDGHQPEPHDFPIARTFSDAVHYLLAEEQANELWGHGHPAAGAHLQEPGAAAVEPPGLSPTMEIPSSLPRQRAGWLANMPQISRSARQWLALFVFGGVWLSLGVAYLLTHLYRIHPFPAFVWYLTLQFIPRPIRGLLFIVTGLLVVAISLRAFVKLFPNGHQRRR